MPTVRKYFDALVLKDALLSAPDKPINLIFDATFFGREYGFLCFCDTAKIVYYEEIVTESVAVLEACLLKMKAAGYQFYSFTLDGKRGFIPCLQRLFPNTPIQFCHFHQQAIIRRYITNNPKYPAAIELKKHMALLNNIEPPLWIEGLQKIEQKFADTLSAKNAKGQFIHRRLRAAFRSLHTNIPYLFAYKKFPELNIPNTTNYLEGRFSHVKEKINIHRGLNINRKKKAIQFLLQNT